MLTTEDSLTAPSLAPAWSEAQRRAFLNEIPSETTVAERLLLFNLFRDQWDGQGKVIEIGPFLGGTTRAIALGMIENPRLSPDAEFHTIDRFGSYYTPDNLRALVDPLVISGSLAPAEADRLSNLGGFLPLFNAIHGPHSYFPLLRIHDTPLPDLPGEISTATALARFDRDDDLGALFIDGCKSWASTHYAMTCLLPRLRLNAPVIFQDFGWYTCFWISSFVHAFEDVLEFDSRMDPTYVFRLKTRLSAAQVAERFPKTPAELGPGFFKRASESLLRRSQQSGDTRGALISQLHYIAALVTLDRRADASLVLKSLNVREYADHIDMIRGCINSPTYLPGGKALRWK